MNAHYTKTLVCLANSRKPPEGRCVAGREVTALGFGDWVRAVSSRPTHELTPQERCYKNGKDPGVLDVIAIRMKSPQGAAHQQENHVIDAAQRWVQVGRLDWPALQSAVEDPAGPLWINGYSSSRGRNDRVPENALGKLLRSLWLVRPENLIFSVASEGDVFGPEHRRARAEFRLCSQSYKIVVTDPWIEAELLPKDDGRYEVNDALLCVSLGEVFHGYAYKLAAMVITPQRATG